MARPTRKTTATKKKPASYEFDMLPVAVVTPLASTHFMCLAEENEVTGKFGGSLLFTDADLDQEVNFKEWTTKEKWQDGFFEGVDAMIDDALDEYNSNNKKPAEKADKFLTHFDKDDNETEFWEFKIKNNEQPKIVDKHKQRIPDFDELLGNGSQIKVQVNLKPYFMQGKVGVTAYVDYVLIKEVVEYGGGAGGNPFDDDDFEEDSNEIDEEYEDEPEPEPEPAKPARRSRKKATPPPAEEEEVDDVEARRVTRAEEVEEEEVPVKTKRTRRSKAQIEADKKAEEEADEPEVKSTRKKRTVKKTVAEPAETTDNEEEAEPEVKPARKRRVRATKAPAEAEVPGEDDDF